MPRELSSVKKAYLFQAVLILIWWLGITFFPKVYGAFEFSSLGREQFNYFLIPDLLLLCGLSIICSWSYKKEIAYVVLGGFAYATFYCLSATWHSDSGYLSSLCMIVGLLFNLLLCFQDKLFRESRSTSFLMNFLKTIFQIVLVWSIFLYVIPEIIDRGIETVSEGRRALGLIGYTLLFLCSSLGILSSYFMTRDGLGTPLPMDSTTNLVTRGPYRFVRNPMAIAGLGQGLGVAMMRESVGVLLYVLLGLFVWNFFVRPIEEEDLTLRFGDEYRNYCEKVKCWFPNFSKLT